MESNNNWFYRIVSRQEFGVSLALIILVLVFYFINPAFLGWGNIAIMLKSGAFVGVMAVGVAWLLISGSIDLSIGAIAGLASVVTAYLVVKLDFPILVSVILGLSTGAFIGIVNYILIFKAKIPAFLATIGTMYIARGLAFFIADGFSIYPLPKSVGAFGTGGIFNLSWHFFIFITLLIISEIIISNTVYGLEVRATGSDREIAFMTEVNTKKVSISTSIIVGVLSALSGILLMSRLVTGDANQGTGWELQAITACAIGGISLFGYSGTFLGVFLGVLVLQVIQNGLVVIGLSAYLNTIVVGIILATMSCIDWQRRSKLNL